MLWYCNNRSKKGGAFFFIRVVYGKGIFPSFLIAFVRLNVQLCRSGDAKTACNMPKRETWDRVTDRLTERSIQLHSLRLKVEFGKDA